MKNTPLHRSTPITHEEQQRLAYQLWERANCPTGKDIDFWIEAEKQLTAKQQAKQGPATTHATARPKAVKSKVAHANPNGAARTKPVPKSTTKKSEPGSTKNGKKARLSAK